MRSVFLLLIFCSISYCLDRWPNHDISTLKVLQIIHRHGDRAPVSFGQNDPFQNESYWPHGIKELTNKGRYRLYKTGQFIRKEYHQYLGDKYSAREVYARSSITGRCIESLSSLLAGAYPPNNKEWQWNNGTDDELGQIWQPIPIETVLNESMDNILKQVKSCPIVDRERVKIYNRTYIKQFVADNKELYNNLTKITGKNMVDILSACSIFSTLQIETDNNYVWSEHWTKEEQMNVVSKLLESQKMRYRYNWDTPIIHRLRAGGFVMELNKNFNLVFNNQNNKKLYVYSTHDTMIAPVMQSLGIFNDNPPPFGATLIFELHEKKDSTGEASDYFVRAFYHNETVINSGTPHPLEWGICGNVFDCPFDQYLNSTKHLFYENLDKECNEQDQFE